MSINQQHTKLDTGRFDKLHSAYHDRLMNSMTGFVRNREDAEEITAAAFAKAFEKRATFRGEAAPQSWVYTIALNAARRHPKRNRTVSLESLPEPVSLVECDAASQLERSEIRLRLQRALSRIPAVYCRVLVQHFMEGRSVKEIARRERVPLGTVLSRIFTGKRLLRRAWEAVT